MKNMLWFVLLLWSTPLFSQETIEWMIPLGKYDNIRPWGDYFVVNEHGRWGVLNNKFKAVIAPQFSDIQVMNDWALAIRKNDKWGFRHRKDLLKWAVQPIYEDLGWGPGTKRNPGHEDSWIFRIKEKEWAVTISKEKIVVEEPGKYPLAVEELLDNDAGEEESTPTSTPQPFVVQPWHSQWKEVHPVYYLYDESKKNPSQDVFEVVDGEGKHGMADAQGNILIPVRYHWLAIVNPQTIGVREGNEYNKPSLFSFFRRSDGKPMSEEEYGYFRRPRPHENSPLQVWEPRSPDGEPALAGLLSASGEEMVPCEYQNFAEESPLGFISAKQDGRWGLINMKNKVLLPFEYDYIEIRGLENASFILVSKGRETGVLRVK